MPGIRVRDNESIDRTLKIFKKQIEKAGIMSELRKRQHYEKPCMQRKKKRAAAQKRSMKTIRSFS